MEKIEPNVGNEGPVRRVLFFALSAVNIAMGCWAIWAGLNDSAPLFSLFDEPVPSHASFVPVFSLHLIVTGTVFAAASGLMVIFRSMESWWSMLSLYLLMLLVGNMFVTVAWVGPGSDLYGGVLLFLVPLLPLYILFSLQVSSASPYPGGVMNVKREVYSLREFAKGSPYIFFFSLLISAFVVYYFVVFNVILFTDNISDRFWQMVWIPILLFAVSMTLFLIFTFVLGWATIPLMNGYNNWLAKHFASGEYKPVRPRNERPSKGWPSLDEVVDGPIVKLTRIGSIFRYGIFVIVGLSIYCAAMWLIPVPEEDGLFFTRAEQMFENLTALTVAAED